MASAFDSINKTNTKNSISKCIGESLTSQVSFSNCIDLSNAAVRNPKKVKDEQKIYYNLNIYRNKGSFNILNNISEHVTLIQLMDYLGNANHAISVVGY